MSDNWMEESDHREMWSHGPRVAVWVIVILAILVAGVHGIRTWLLPAEEELRRDTYEESKSYIDGTIRDLDNLHREWLNSEEEHKPALAAMALRRSVDFPADRLPEDIREWLDDLREERGNR